MPNWRQGTRSTKVELYSEETSWKMIRDLVQYSLNKDHQHPKWQQLRSWISYPDCQEAQDKQRTQYQLEPKWKWRMLTNCWKFPNRNVQTFGFVYHDTNCLNHSPVWKTQSFLLKGICTVNLWQDFMGKAIWENLIETWLGDNSKLEMSLCTSWKRIILICVCGWHKIGWKETKSWSDVETTKQRSWFGGTNIFPGSCIHGMHSTRMPNKQRYCGQLQNHVRIANFRGLSGEITILLKFSYFFMVLWHSWSCKEMCWAILWVFQQVCTATLQSICSMHWWPSLKRRMEIRRRIVKSILSNCSEMLVLGTHWTTWYSMVSK